MRLFCEEAEDGFGGFLGFFVIMEVAGAGDEFEFGANFFGESFSIAFADDAIRFTGKKKSVFLEREVGDGILSRKLRGGIDFAGARDLVAATLIGDFESFFEEFVVVRDEEKAGGDIVGD